MLVWQIWCLVGVLLFILELFTPVLFFLNLAVACFVAAIAAYFGASFFLQTAIFFTLSVIFVFLVRPLLLRKINHDSSKETGIESKYIGAQAKVIKDVSKTAGRIAIYGEEWEARAINDETLVNDTLVRIISSENLIMYVEKL